VIIRELLTSIGIDFDKKGADEAEKKTNSLKNALESVGTVLSFGAVFSGMRTVVGMASDAEQTMSKLHMMFAENTEGVLDWADATAKATGASKYDLREFAGTMGSMLVPTLKGNRKLAAEMSTSLSALAVDLAAINNEDPKETLGRLFSGMTGETEGVERLGIGIKQAALQEFAHSKGIKTKVTAMTIAQKTELIYQKMLYDTKDKLGAAAKESKSFAGLSLRLSAAFKDAGTNLGVKLLPFANEFVSLLTRGVGVLGDWAEDTTKVSSAFAVLGSVMGVMGLRLLALNLPLIGFAIGCGLVYIAVQDLVKSFTEGKGAVASLMEYLVGNEAWERMRKLPGMIGEIAFEMGKLSETDRKMRGIKDKSYGDRAFDFLSTAMGYDPEERRKKLAEDRANYDLKKYREEQAAKIEAQRNPGWLNYTLNKGFNAATSWKKDFNVAADPYLNPAFSKDYDAASRTVINNINVAGNADPGAIKAIDEVTRRALMDERRNLNFSTRTIDTDVDTATYRAAH
jgi:hypothetical protein